MMHCKKCRGKMDRTDTSRDDYNNWKCRDCGRTLTMFRLADY